MIEKVAEAICDALGGHISDSDLLKASRAAIAAMREPTEAMIEAVKPLGLCRPEDADEIWQAMIDEALK